MRVPCYCRFAVRAATYLHLPIANPSRPPTRHSLANIIAAVNPQALQGLGPEVLTELAGRMEAALSRVRAAALAAAAERAHQCPVCWEARKGLVFGCGHQTCVDCGEKLAACPICREPVALRIRVYG